MLDLYSVSKEKVAPVLYCYVNWILEQARKKKLHTLYFLARDGYVLKEIAEIICERQGWSIECRYLYCSRASLRMPIYYFIGNEAYDLIFASGYHVTIKTFFDRIGMSENEINVVLQEMGLLGKIDVSAELSEGEIADYKSKLCKSTYLNRFLKEKSQSAYPFAIEYFKQEELFDKETVAIVDSGWTGSMQRSLRQLLEKEGWKGKLVGFYFGLYMEQRPEDGEYLTFYFDWNTDLQNKNLFCNNLFEIFLSAPHGMTIGYRKNEEKNIIEPIFQEHGQANQNDKINEQIKGILDGIKNLNHQEETYGKRKCQTILRKMMGHPSAELVNLYGEFVFCDDITEKYHFKLMETIQNKKIKELLLYRKIWVRLKKYKKIQYFWEYGEVALIKNPIRRMWYWINVYIWNHLRYSMEGSK